MLNKYHPQNNKTFTYNVWSFGIFRKVPAEMVDNLLLNKNLSKQKNKVEKLQFIQYLTSVNVNMQYLTSNIQSPFLR